MRRARGCQPGIWLGHERITSAQSQFRRNCPLPAREYSIVPSPLLLTLPAKGLRGLYFQIYASSRLYFSFADHSFHGSYRKKVVARLDSRCGKQPHHLRDRHSNGAVWLSSRQSVVHRTLCSQSRELASRDAQTMRSVSRTERQPG